MPKDISQFGKGCLIKEPSIRDYRLETMLARATILPSSYSLKDKIGKIKNQGKSYSCVGQAIAYYVQLLNFLETGKQVEMSARDVYSTIYQPEGGAYIVDGMKKICNSGCVEEKDAPSYENGVAPSEAFMKNRADITSQESENGMTYLAKKYCTFEKKNVEKLKIAIYEGTGAVVACDGNNTCWADGEIEVPEKVNWAHGILMVGWDDTKKVFEFVNSWNGWGFDGFG
ncbi:MAG TPA: hypothetical protein P5056_04235, partial [Candidatus Paceibacterota bacterium]|nr:hypothetical protein [Candidatus Paceibacterota bacterium]